MLAEADEKIKARPFLTSDYSIGIASLNGLFSPGEREIEYANFGSHTINPAFTTHRVKYACVDIQIYSRLDCRQFMETLMSDSDVVFFPLDVSRTPRSVLQSYDAVVVTSWALAEELCYGSGRLRCIRVVCTPSAIALECVVKEILHILRNTIS